MAKDLVDRDFLDKFKGLDQKEQEKIIEKLSKNKKATGEKPPTSANEGRREKGAAASWG